jgi:hypothetical protein
MYQAHFVESRIIDHIETLKNKPQQLTLLVTELSSRYALKYEETLRCTTIAFYVRTAGNGGHTYPVIFDYANSTILCLNAIPTHGAPPEGDSKEERMLLKIAGPVPVDMLQDFSHPWSVLATVFNIQNVCEPSDAKIVLLSKQSVCSSAIHIYLTIHPHFPSF